MQLDCLAFSKYFIITDALLTNGLRSKGILRIGRYHLSYFTSLEANEFSTGGV